MHENSSYAKAAREAPLVRVLSEAVLVPVREDIFFEYENEYDYDYDYEYEYEYDYEYEYEYDMKRRSPLD